MAVPTCTADAPASISSTASPPGDAADADDGQIGQGGVHVVHRSHRDRVDGRAGQTAAPAAERGSPGVRIDRQAEHGVDERDRLGAGVADRVGDATRSTTVGVSLAHRGRPQARPRRSRRRPPADSGRTSSWRSDPGSFEVRTRQVDLDGDDRVGHGGEQRAPRPRTRRRCAPRCWPRRRRPWRRAPAARRATTRATPGPCRPTALIMPAARLVDARRRVAGPGSQRQRLHDDRAEADEVDVGGQLGAVPGRARRRHDGWRSSTDPTRVLVSHHRSRVSWSSRMPRWYSCSVRTRSGCRALLGQPCGRGERGVDRGDAAARGGCRRPCGCARRRRAAAARGRVDDEAAPCRWRSGRRASVPPCSRRPWRPRSTRERPGGRGTRRCRPWRRCRGRAAANRLAPRSAGRLVAVGERQEHRAARRAGGARRQLGLEERQARTVGRCPSPRRSSASPARAPGRPRGSG